MVIEGGYDALSLDAVISNAGGSRRTIYSHFGGKEGLFVEAVSLLCREVAEPLRDLRIEKVDVDPDILLRTFSVSLLRIILAPRTLALHRLMIAEGKRFPSLAREIWASGHETAVAMLAGWIGRQQERGMLMRGSSLRLATQFVDLVTGAPQMCALVGLEFDGDLDTIARDAVETFLYGRIAHPVHHILPS